jgi:2-polyprenyl-6-methoxyphenol hydroxylase-like FAD-dependent oxidoreductase
LAAGLAQRGIGARVVEIKPQHQVYGVGLLQPGNALRALKAIGVFEACLAVGFQTDEYRYYDSTGNRLATSRLLRIADPNRPAINMLARPALHRILTQAAEQAGAEIRLGVTVESLAESADDVNVRFTDGTSGSYDLIVGADGIRSQMRRQLCGEAFMPRFTGHGCWRVTMPRPADITYQTIHYGLGVKAGLVPLSRQSMYMLVVTNEPGKAWMPEDRLDELLRARMGQFGGLIGELRDSIRSAQDIVYVAIEEVIVPSPWYHGRVLLIGDAAHASSPHIAQGAAMAVEDAVVLAELAANSDPVPTKLESFMQRRYRRCKFVQDVSRQVGEDGNTEDPVHYQERNERIRREFSAPQPRPHELILAEPI